MLGRESGDSKPGRANARRPKVIVHQKIYYVEPLNIAKSKHLTFLTYSISCHDAAIIGRVYNRLSPGGKIDSERGGIFFRNTKLLTSRRLEPTPGGAD
jgi:hypothetical protein